MKMVLQIFRRDENAVGGSSLSKVETVEAPRREALENAALDLCPHRGAVTGYVKGRIAYTVYCTPEGQRIGMRV